MSGIYKVLMIGWAIGFVVYAIAWIITRRETRRLDKMRAD